MKPKRHGLWQFHRALHQRRERPRWWDGEIDRAHQVYQCVSGSFCGGAMVPPEYSKWVVISRCAFRAMRRWNLPQNASTWNALCERIAARAGSHGRSLNKCKVERPHGLLTLESEFAPKPRFRFDQTALQRRLWQWRERAQVKAEIARQEAARLARRAAFAETRCELCRTKKKSKYLGINDVKALGFEPLFQDRWGEICRPCNAKLKPHLKAATAAEEARLAVNRTRRKINESTKNNAAVA